MVISWIVKELGTTDLRDVNVDFVVHVQLDNYLDSGAVSVASAMVVARVSPLDASCYNQIDIDKHFL